MKGCVCRACMGKLPAPAHTLSEDYPPMGDYRWVRIGNNWQESWVTDVGTLLIPKPDYYGTDSKRFLELVNVVAIAHGLDPKKATGVKSWENVIAVHFN